MPTCCTSTWRTASSRPHSCSFPICVAAMRKRSSVPIHVHLMVDDAILLTQVEQFAEAGADLISVHAENGNAAEAVRLITSRGLLAGARAAGRNAGRGRSAAAGGTQHGDAARHGHRRQGPGPVRDGARPHRRDAPHGGVADTGPQRRIVAADGGIRENTVPMLVAAGAQTVVLGSLAFGAPDLGQRIGWLHGLRGALSGHAGGCRTRGRCRRHAGSARRLVDAEGKVMHRQSLRTPADEGAEAVVAAIASACRAVIEACGWHRRA